ncbi:DNA methyltransferase, partial [Microbacterium sp.]|uniref:Eco57I restriction-modification methylase domain-containing protein n=1 Tax=Microbacterium sp. TaxID=51671 RepID=UPI002602E87F
HRDLVLGAEITNKNLLRAIRHLAWILVPGQRAQPIDYRHLGAEELGGVYESLLELVPRVDLDTRQFSLAHLSGNERKTTGSYYTPPALVSALLDASLDPALDEAVAAGHSPAEREANLLAVTVCDPASGSGGFLVAAARRIARRLAQVRSDEDEPTPEAVQRALHDVVARCIYGVDMNDLAAELAKVSLWLEALEPGKPLGFLDARIRVGNSLFGTTPALIAGGVPDAAFKEIEGDSKMFAAEVRKRNKNEATGQGLLSWADPDALAAANRRERALLLAPSDDVDDIRARGEAWDAYLTSDARQTLKRQADAWAAAFVWPLHDGTPLPPTTAVVRAMLDDDVAMQYPDTVDGVDRLASEYRFFHWHLEFPEVFGATTGDGLGPEGWAGGFTCMLGNPPWEQIELKETEFFAARDPEIAKATGAKRKSLIAKLATADPILDKEYRTEKRALDALRKFVSTGRYPLTGRGRVNTYSVFAELFRGLTAPQGRSGVIVPTGIATDATTQYFFKDLVETESLVAFYDFENRRKLFSDVDSRFKFCILSTSGRTLPAPSAWFAFFLDDPRQIEVSRFRLTPDEIMLLNPNTGTVPIVRTRRDAEITLGIYRRVPVLINENDPINGNPWGVSFMQGLFNMTSDSHLFHTRDQLEADGWTLAGNVFERGTDRMLPLYEAKMVHHFNHRWATQDGKDFRDVTDVERASADFEALPRYWVDAGEVKSAGGTEGPWFGFRDITNATNERTMVSSMWPTSGVGNNLPIATSAFQGWILIAVLSSFAFDFVARPKVGGSHINFFIANQLPVLPPTAFEGSVAWSSPTSRVSWISSRVAELAYTSWSMSDWATKIGDRGAPFIWNPERRRHLRAELDAAFFHLYGVHRADVDYMLDTFPIVRRRDEAEFGEYRTKRLIVENYDRMQECIDTGTEFVSTLDPAPGFGPRHPERTTDA